jgi:hypothetical protein
MAKTKKDIRRSNIEKHIKRMWDNINVDNYQDFNDYYAAVIMVAQDEVVLLDLLKYIEKIEYEA